MSKQGLIKLEKPKTACENLLPCGRGGRCGHESYDFDCCGCGLPGVCLAESGYDVGGDHGRDEHGGVHQAHENDCDRDYYCCDAYDYCTAKAVIMPLSMCSGMWQ